MISLMPVRSDCQELGGGRSGAAGPSTDTLT